MTHQYKNQAQDKQAALSGKVENDFNKQGQQKPTQKNEGQRTPLSRHDRESQIGNNQSQARRGAPNQGNKAGPR
ncbi:hypothetical protein FN976_12345 [Caenimonas sedimenti]|uniref:Uncharacterized protein n=1 Tax=Caenimonas sedimenti TaxID=2596921 RepID=A0A562ZR83_9BURK|nr:hypothetical protein [Caenimonas sedimenti]TWO71102.1 hypothetical protein FN976_12345 [Caenimonas sedimenti]